LAGANGRASIENIFAKKLFRDSDHKAPIVCEDSLRAVDTLFAAKERWL